ncbi:rhodanese-like domain-containing protein [bacterium]|nr:rhodanese-like domain-containing protein [bacterium]MBP9808545.1 rhodanese-like domain-containing protein [bacterium]
MSKNLALLLAISAFTWATPTLAIDPVSFDEYKSTVNKIDWKERVITFEQFQKDCQKPGVVILDLRSEAEYKHGHIKGALLMGADIKEEKLKQLVPNKKDKIIVYCTNNFFPSRRISLNNVCLPQMIALGYANVFVLEEIWHQNFDQVEKLKQSSLWQNNSEVK